ncbi:MAG: hypothetical protein K2N23_00245, partial [Clostridia bacterium]|nr:hypothetical protein [Clostridia bacterium]
MTEKCLNEIRSLDNFHDAIIKSIVLDSQSNIVDVRIITDRTFQNVEREKVSKIIRKYIPLQFECRVEVNKLSPDTAMVKQKILEAVKNNFKAISVTVTDDDIKVKKTERGFEFTIGVIQGIPNNEICTQVVKYLKRNFCGEFFGECVESVKNTLDIQVDEEQENIEFEMPVRYFNISKFSNLEGSEKQKTAVYLSDLNFEGEKVVVCGTIQDIHERNYTNSKNQEKTYYNYTLSDGTATLRVTYFPRLKSIDKIRPLKVGDSIVCTGKTELFNGFLRYTANIIDLGSVPDNFVPEKRPSKPIPKFYSVVKPKVFTDIAQTDMFDTATIPDCLKNKTFVVFDLETTGLNSTPTSGNMDAIIEIGAYKIVDGVISESFSTFVNPQRKLSEEIINLTGITEEMVKDAPKYDEVMPDFFKFCQGNIIVGHNMANFDFKFVDYYCSRLGYTLERKIIDTIPLAQELLFLSNYKLNTIADHFKITFNHHR